MGEALKWAGGKFLKGVAAGLAIGIPLAILAVVVAVVACHIDDPRESLCEQGAVLQTGRLLDRSGQIFALATEEGDSCGEEGQRTVGKEQSEAIRRFSSAAARPEAQKKQAIELYVRGLKLNPFDATAGAALAKLLEEPKGLPAAELSGGLCGLARRLTKAGLLAGADPVIAAGWSGQNSDKAACEAALRKLNNRKARAAERLRKAQALGNEPDRRAARVMYARALHANPALSEARAGLEGGVETGSYVDAIGRRLDGAPDTAKNMLSWLLPLAIGLMLLVLAGRFVLTELAKRRPGARRKMIDLGQSWPFKFLYKAAAPRVTVATFSGGESPKGEDFSALLANALPRRSGRGPAFPFDRVSRGSAADADAASDATKLLDAFAETKLLGSLWVLFKSLFRRSIEVGGHLAPIADRGAGVSVSIEGADEMAEHEKLFWEREFDPQPGGDGAGRWLRMLPAVAVWTRWQLAAAYGPSKKAPDPTGWLADAFFHSGVAWHNRSDLVRAGILYTLALEREPDHFAAAYNLAMVELRSGQYRQARERLISLRARLKDAELPEDWSGLETAALYGLALSYAYAAPEEQA